MTPPAGRGSTATSTTRGRGATHQTNHDQPKPGSEGVEGPAARAATIRLPFFTARFEVPGRLAGDGWRLGPVSVPSPGKSVYYVGLGVLAVAELVEWPVAVAIAAGTYVAQHTRGASSALPRPASSGPASGPARDGRSGV